MPTVISVENLGKKYTISHQHREEYSSLRDVITNGVRSLSKKLFSPLSLQPSPLFVSEDFWAMKDVSFEVKQGDRIGIIGRNGAGKSTLLKILSRITEPTTGSVRIKGRVASLLEVGTGFHPELTGRENIYLNGAILGMQREEIRRKFDEIVDFAEIEKFLDTPVKRYSSGMYVRLAFAVAAHLEPEILIVDEVLAVGDAQFQKKCLGKMEDVSAKQGRTVLFVSHNMSAIQSLCHEVILLERGQIVQKSETAGVIEYYLKKGTQFSTCKIWDDPADAPGNEKAQLRSVKLLDENNRSVEIANIDNPVVVEVEYLVHKPDTVLNLSLSLYNKEEIHVFASPSISDVNWYLKKHPSGVFKSRCIIPGSFLNQGQYSLSVLLVEDGAYIIGLSDREVSIDMIDSGSSRGSFFGTWSGVVRPNLNWNTDCLSMVEADKPNLHEVRWMP